MAWPNDGEVEVRDREKHILDISKIPRQADSKKDEAKVIKKLSEVFAFMNTEFVYVGRDKHFKDMRRVQLRSVQVFINLSAVASDVASPAQPC